MKYFPFIILIFLFVECKPDNSSSDPSINDTSFDNQLDKKPSSIVDIISDEEEYRNYKCEKNQVIDRVFYLKETNEFYISIGFKDEVSDSSFTSIASKFNQVVFEDDENLRKRITPDLAKKYFDLTCLSEIRIFNKNNELITKANLIRVEYLEQTIQSEFIAVYKPENKIKSENEIFYCISGDTNYEEDVKSDEIKNLRLETLIKEKLNINSTNIWKIQHIKIQKENTIYSIISFSRTNEGNAESYLTQFRNDELTILNHLNEEGYIYWDLFPVRAFKNGKPIFLTEVAVPETDVISYIPLEFNLKEYIVAKKSRIERE